MTRRDGALFIAYEGAGDALVHTQVLPYLRGMRKAGIRLSLMTFERRPSPSAALNRRRARCCMTEAGIAWLPLRYHKRPSALVTLFDVLCGIVAGVAEVRRRRLAIVHARSLVPGLMALVIAKVTGARMLYDARNLWTHWKAESGVWRRGSALVRLAWKIERTCLKSAAAVVVLTDAMRRYVLQNGYVRPHAPLEVIPCCVDLQRFTLPPETRTPHQRASGAPFTLVYAGSLEGFYQPMEMVAFFVRLRKHVPSARFIILSNDPADRLEPLLRSGLWEHCEIRRAAAVEVPRYLQAAHAGISFRQAGLSQLSASPTKIAEYLACGLPVVVSAGIGDVDTMLSSRAGGGVGVIVSRHEPGTYDEAIDALLALCSKADIAERCRRLARERFSLEDGVSRYLALYRRLQGGSPFETTSPRTSVTAR